MTNESVKVTPEDIETLALLHEAFGNQPAAFTLRNVGVVGTVLEVQAQIIAKHRTRHQSQERGAVLTVGDLEGLIAGQPSPRDAAMAILAALTTPAPAVSTDALCEDCPPVGYPTDKTRCDPCPRRVSTEEIVAVLEAGDKLADVARRYGGAPGREAIAAWKAAILSRIRGEQ